jgi:hypothetical protein
MKNVLLFKELDFYINMYPHRFFNFWFIIMYFLLI